MQNTVHHTSNGDTLRVQLNQPSPFQLPEVVSAIQTSDELFETTRLKSPLHIQMFHFLLFQNSIDIAKLAYMNIALSYQSTEKDGYIAAEYSVHLFELHIYAITSNLGGRLGFSKWNKLNEKGVESSKISEI